MPLTRIGLCLNAYCKAVAQMAIILLKQRMICGLSSIFSGWLDLRSRWEKAIGSLASSNRCPAIKQSVIYLRVNNFKHIPLAICELKFHFLISLLLLSKIPYIQEPSCAIRWDYVNNEKWYFRVLWHNSPQSIILEVPRIFALNSPHRDRKKWINSLFGSLDRHLTINRKVLCA